MARIPVIFIIDDDASVREGISGLVRSLGYATATFASADEYLQSGRLREPSCLITDVQMPNMSGVELQERLLADGHRTPIIFVTAFPQEKVRTQALEAGAIAFLSKPFHDECLIASLDSALNLNGADPTR